MSHTSNWYLCDLIIGEQWIQFKHSKRGDMRASDKQNWLRFQSVEKVIVHLEITNLSEAVMSTVVGNYDTNKQWDGRSCFI